MQDGPCKRCEKRHPKCHGKCEEYKAWRKKIVKPYKRDEVTEFLIKNITKTNRKRR